MPEMLELCDGVDPAPHIHAFRVWLQAFGSLVVGVSHPHAVKLAQNHLRIWQSNFSTEKLIAFRLEQRYNTERLSIHKLRGSDRDFCQSLLSASASQGVYLLLAKLQSQPVTESIGKSEIELESVYSCDGNKVLNRLFIKRGAVFERQVQSDNTAVALLIPKRQFSALLNEPIEATKAGIVSMVLVDMEEQQDHETIVASRAVLSQALRAGSVYTGINEIIQYSMAQGDRQFRQALSQAIWGSEFHNEFNRLMETYIQDSTKNMGPSLLLLIFDPIAELSTLESLESNFELFIRSIPSQDDRNTLKQKAEAHFDAKIRSQTQFDMSHLGFLVQLIESRRTHGPWLETFLVPALTSRAELELLNKLDQIFGVPSCFITPVSGHTHLANTLSRRKRPAEDPPAVSTHDTQRRRLPQADMPLQAAGIRAPAF